MLIPRTPKKVFTSIMFAFLTLGALSQMVSSQTTVAAPSSLSETYGQWIVRCATPEVGEGAAPAVQLCEMAQDLYQRDSGQRILAISLQPGTGEGASLTLITPFGLLLSEGITIEVDEAVLLQTGFRTCLPAGCVAVAELDQANVDALAIGQNATVIMTSTNTQQLSITVSLDGFTSAWNRLKDIL